MQNRPICHRLRKISQIEHVLFLSADVRICRALIGRAMFVRLLQFIAATKYIINDNNIHTRRFLLADVGSFFIGRYRLTKIDLCALGLVYESRFNSEMYCTSPYSSSNKIFRQRFHDTCTICCARKKQLAVFLLQQNLYIFGERWQHIRDLI
jgi:hypothetical protein